MLWSKKMDTRIAALLIAALAGVLLAWSWEAFKTQEYER